MSQARFTDISLDEFELLRRQLQDLANLARSIQAEVYESHLPLITQAAIDDWQSIAKWSYDFSLGAARGQAESIAVGCGAIAATYDGLDWVLEQEKGVQFG